ncbi:MAG: AAA family ATPase, partial [Chloroflexota bacterium]
KTVLERKAPPTFDILVEIRSWEEVCVYSDVAEAVDAMLRGEAPHAELRVRGADGNIQISDSPSVAPTAPALQRRPPAAPHGRQRIFPVGLRSDRLAEAIQELGVPATVERELSQATMVMTLRQYYQRDVPWVRRAESRGVPVYVLRGGSYANILRQLAGIFDSPGAEEQGDEEGGEESDAAMGPEAAAIGQLQRRIADRYRGE